MPTTERPAGVFFWRRANLRALDHLLAAAEAFLHDAAHLLNFELQLLADEVHLPGKLQQRRRPGVTHARPAGPARTAPCTRIVRRVCGSNPNAKTLAGFVCLPCRREAGV